MLIRPENPTACPPPVYPVWLQLGFRPFYLAAALFALLAVPWWLWQWQVWQPDRALAGLVWHQHEMPFGFVAAVITGFLFTAGRVWTGLATPAGPTLLGFLMIWLAARLWLLVAYGAGAAVLDAVFLPAVATVLLRLIWRSRNLRNLPIVGILAALAACNIAFHGYLLGLWPGDPVIPVHAGVGLIILLVAVMGGRVIPGFTANALPEAQVHRRPWLDVTALILLAAALVAVIFPGIPSSFTFITALIAAMLHVARLLCWDPWATRHKPILWILHLSYAWIPVGLLLLALAALGYVPASSGWHALTVGAMGGMISGMITRTALGHTGRPLVAGTVEVVFYLLVQAAALIRVIPSVFWPETHVASTLFSGVLWSAGFLVYLFGYAPRLVCPRVDGKPG